MLLTRIDPFSNKCNTVDLPVTQEEIQLWKDGMLAQNAFPKCDADQREFIITGIMPESWEEATKPCKYGEEESE